MVRILSLLSLLIAGGAAFGQADVDASPSPYRGPAPTTRGTRERESLYRYAWGLLCERNDKLIDALLAFEESVKLDPRAARASGPRRRSCSCSIGLATRLDRVEAALKIDPEDHHGWFLAARIHKGFGEMTEFRTCVEKGLACPGLVDDDPALAQQLYLDLARYLETTDNPAEAVAPYRAALKILDHPDLVLEHGPLIERQAIVAKSAEVYEKLGDLHPSSSSSTRRRRPIASRWRSDLTRRAG